MDGEAAWAPPNDSCELISFRYLHLEKKIMFHKGFFNLSRFKCALSQEVKKKKKRKMCPYSGVTAGWDGVGQLPGHP